MRHSTAPPSSGIRLNRALIERRRKTGGSRLEKLLTEDPVPGSVHTHTAGLDATTALNGAAPANNIGALLVPAFASGHVGPAGVGAMA